MAALERVVDGAYAFGALSASDTGAGLYAARGRQPWRGRIAVQGPDGVERLPDEEGRRMSVPRQGARCSPRPGS